MADVGIGHYGMSHAALRRRGRRLDGPPMRDGPVGTAICRLYAFLQGERIATPALHKFVYAKS